MQNVSGGKKYAGASACLVFSPFTHMHTHTHARARASARANMPRSLLIQWNMKVFNKSVFFTDLFSVVFGDCHSQSLVIISIFPLRAPSPSGLSVASTLTLFFPAPPLLLLFLPRFSRRLSSNFCSEPVWGKFFAPISFVRRCNWNR